MKEAILVVCGEASLYTFWTSRSPGSCKVQTQCKHEPGRLAANGGATSLGVLLGGPGSSDEPNCCLHLAVL